MFYLLFIDENQQNINNQYNINFRAKYGKIPDICKHYKATKFPLDAVLSTSGGNSIYITREFQRHREGETTDNDSVFSYPGLRFAPVYRRCVHTRVWRN